jgi:hypothetical protein
MTAPWLLSPVSPSAPAKARADPHTPLQYTHMISTRTHSRDIGSAECEYQARLDLVARVGAGPVQLVERVMAAREDRPLHL